MALTNIGDALKHIYQLTQPKDNGSSKPATTPPPTSTATTNNISINSANLLDPTNLRQQQGLNASHKKVSLVDYKDAVGRDSAFVKDTLRNKLSELGLPARTQVQISKDTKGNIEAIGSIQQEALDQINQDLNNNKPFKAAFLRLSVNEPTLDYVDNVVNLSKAYGVDNSLFGSLISREQGNNNLTDIANRYEKLKSSYQTDPLVSANSVTQNEDYHFVLNA